METQEKKPMTFEDLQSWQEARQLTREIYTLTRKAEIGKDFGLCGQVQRAAVSIMSNIAEGFERRHVPEKLQFYNIAHASSAEVRSLTYVIEDNYPTMATDAALLRDRVSKCGRLLNGLKRSTETRKGKVVATALLLVPATLALFVLLLFSR